MKEPFTYQICVEGQLSESWSDWFDGLEIRNEPDGNATMIGTLADQAVLMGILNRILALNLPLISVYRVAKN
jgi:hypothetical protein